MAHKEDIAKAPETPDARRPRKLVSTKQLLGFSFLAILIYAGILFIGDTRTIFSLIGDVNLAWVALALLLVSVGYLVRAARWTYLIHSLGQPAPTIPSATAFLSGFALAVTPGKVGELVKVYYQNRDAQTPYETSFAVALAERALDVIALCLVFAAGLLVTDSLEIRYALIPILIAVVGILIIRSRRLATSILTGIGRHKRLSKPAAALQRTQHEISRVLRGRRLLLGTFLGILAWGLEPLAMALLARGLGLQVPISACAVVFAGSTLFSVLTFIPGGLASYEGSSVVLLHQFFGLTLASAAALTLLTRLATLWFGVLIGLLAMIALRAKARNAATQPAVALSKPQD